MSELTPSTSAKEDRSIVFPMQMGGAGKTDKSLMVAVFAALRNPLYNQKKILVMDADCQQDLSQSFLSKKAK